MDHDTRFPVRNNTKNKANLHLVRDEINNIKYLRWEKEGKYVVKIKKKPNIQQLVFAGRHRPNY